MYTGTWCSSPEVGYIRRMHRACTRAVLVYSLTLVGCGTDGGSGSTNGSELSCTGSSNLAMLWSLVESGTFLNPSELPTPGVGWVNYIHPNWPLLSFLHPPDWTPTTLSGGQAVGVDLLRNDAGGLYHNFGTWDMTGVSVADWVDETIDRAFVLMNAAGTPTVLCSLPATTRQLAPGVFQVASGAVVVTNDTVVLAAVSLNSVDGLPGNNVNINTVGGRNNEFNQIADDVFFPIYFQLLVGREPLQDTDNDGTPDVNDNFPLDPARQ